MKMNLNEPNKRKVLIRLTEYIHKTQQPTKPTPLTLKTLESQTDWNTIFGGIPTQPCKVKFSEWMDCRKNTALHFKTDTYFSLMLWLLKGTFNLYVVHYHLSVKIAKLRCTIIMCLCSCRAAAHWTPWPRGTPLIPATATITTITATITLRPADSTSPRTCSSSARCSSTRPCCRGPSRRAIFG